MATPGAGERAVEEREPLALVGPHRRAQDEAVVLAGGVERLAVAAAPAGHLHARGRHGRRALVDVLEAHRRRGGTEGEARRAVAVAVPVEVQPGAGPQLEHAQRQPAVAGHGEEPGEQAGGAARLVGLQRLAEQGAQRVRALLEQRAEVRPGLRRRSLAAGRRVPAGERGRVAGEHEAVHAREQPQRQRVPGGLAGPLAQQPPGRAAGRDIVSRALEQPDVERRAALHRPRGLPPQAPLEAAGVGLGGRPGHAAQSATSAGAWISRLRILPVGPLGSSSTNQIRRGYL